MAHSFAPAHHEAALVAQDVRRAQRVPPPPRKVPFRITHQEAAIQPPPPVAVDLRKRKEDPQIVSSNAHLEPRRSTWRLATYVFLRQADEPVARPDAAHEVELAPRRMSLSDVDVENECGKVR